MHRQTFSKAHAHIILAFLIGFYLVNGIAYLSYQSLTSDEGDFYKYAVRLLKGQPDRIIPNSDNSKTPVVILNTLPRIFEEVFDPEKVRTDGGFSDIIHGRWVTLFVSVFTILVVFRWADALYGRAAGLFAAFLFTICPNNLANAGLVTTDSYSVLFLVATFYYLWKFGLRGNKKDYLFFCLFIALSQLVKQSLFHLYILFPLCIGINFAIHPAKITFKKVLYSAAVFAFINVMVINAGYYFYHTGYAIGDYKFTSQLFLKLQQSLPDWTPIPFPHPFIEGLDQAKYYDQIGGGYENICSFGKVTILGESSTGGSFWYYYLVTLLFKTPISFLLFFFGALWLRVKGKTFRRSDTFFLLMPVGYYLIVFSFFYNTQVGVRHIIFVYPLLFIFSSQLVNLVQSAKEKVIILLLSVFAFCSMLFYWKNYIPYTNELIFNKSKAYRYVGADNIEQLQGGNYLKMYLRQHPEVKLAPKTPQKGIFAISLKEYLDLWHLHEYDWIAKYPPVGHIAKTYLLIKVD